MNNIEKQMVDKLIDLKENYNVIGVKAEFEAEGTRLEEALKLKEVVSKAELDLIIKIGGCEAVKDLYEAKAIGVSKVVAPMIESPFALKKFINAATLVYPKSEGENVQFFINIETITAFKFLDEILESPAICDLHGIVIGRGDLSESTGLSREHINTEEIFKMSSEIIIKAKKQNLLCGMGGGISAESIPFLKNLPQGLDFFETRKILFDKNKILEKNPEGGILKAVEFELMWLKNKQNHYYSISNEDKARINILESIIS